MTLLDLIQQLQKIAENNPDAVILLKDSSDDTIYQKGDDRWDLHNPTKVYQSKNNNAVIEF
jgi:hypothetical protein